jgi:hypothetical protein
VALRPDKEQQFTGRDRRIKVFIYISWSIVAIIFIVVMMLRHYFPVSQPDAQQSPAEFFVSKPSAINTVRNGYLKYSKTITIGQALEHTFQNGQWKTFTTEKGATFVEFDGTEPLGQLRESNPQLWHIVCETAQTCDALVKRINLECQEDATSPKPLDPDIPTCLENAYKLNDPFPFPVIIKFSINQDGTFQYESNDMGLETEDLFEKMYH